MFGDGLFVNSQDKSISLYTVRHAIPSDSNRTAAFRDACEHRGSLVGPRALGRRRAGTRRRLLRFVRELLDDLGASAKRRVLVA
jgi:hypothetical protein